MGVFTDEDGGGVKPWVTYAVIGIAVFIGGYFVYGAWTKGDRPNTVTLMCSTKGCGYTRAEALQVGETLPLKCPKCGKDTVVVAYRCPDCKTPVILNEEIGLNPPARCPKCGAEVWHAK